MVKKTLTTQTDNPTVEELMAMDHTGVDSITYTQLAAEHPEVDGYRVLASREVAFQPSSTEPPVPPSSPTTSE